MSIWVSDASPINYLARLGLLHVFQQLLGEVQVPTVVVKEIDNGRRIIDELSELRSLDWVQIVPGVAATCTERRLGPGEAEVLSLAESLQVAGKTEKGTDLFSHPWGAGDRAVYDAWRLSSLRK